MDMLLEILNNAGSKFVEFALPMLIQSSLLILIILAADLLLKKKVRAVFRYWIWMLVLVKLVLPVSLYSPLSLGSWFGEKIEYKQLTQEDTGQNAFKTERMNNNVPAIRNIRPIVGRGENLPVLPIIREREVIENRVAANPVTPVSETIVTEPAAASEVEEESASISWQAIVFLVWIAIAVVLCIVLIKRTIFIKEIVTKALEIDFVPANSPSQNEVLKHCCIYIGMKRQVPLRISPDATSPVVCGLFRPVILLPQNLISSLTPSQLKAIFFHELAHIKRGDLWVNMLQTLLQIVYFYNPFLWLANSIIRRTREQAVDEMALVAMGKDAREYPETLLNIAKLAFKRPALSLRLIGVVESEDALAGRIKHMLSRPWPKSAKLGLLGLIVVIVAAVILLPMAKKENKLRLKNIEFSINRNDEENIDIKTQYAGACELMKTYVEALLDNNENAIADITSNANENTKKLRLSYNEIDKIKELNIESYSPSRWRTLTTKQSNLNAKVSLFGTGNIKRIDGVRHSFFAIITQINDSPWQLKDARWYRIETDIEESGKLLSKELAESAAQLVKIVKPDEIISVKDKEDLEKEFVRLNKATLKLLKGKDSSDSDSTLYGYKISPAGESIVIYSFPFFDALKKGDLDSRDITYPAVLKSKLERISEICNLDNIEIDEIYSSQSFAIVLTKGIQRNDGLPYQLGFTFLCPFGQWTFNDIDWIDTENRPDFIEGFKNNFPNVVQVFSSDYSTMKNTANSESMGNLENWGEIVNGIRVHLGGEKPVGLYFSDNSQWYEIENNSRNTIEINTQPFAQKGTDKSQSGYLEIVDANDKVVGYKWSTENNFREIQSGKRYRLDNFLDGQPLSSAKPGTYKARVTLVARDVETDETFEVQSNWHEFEVTLCGHPKDFIPQTDFDKFQFASACRFMVPTGYKTKEEVISMFEDIIKEFPDSKYELGAHYAIAMVASEDRAPDLVTESDYAMSRKHYQEIIRKWPDVVTAETIHARFQAYSEGAEFEQSRLDLYKWLKSLTTEQKVNSISFVNPARQIECTKEDIQRWVDSITDNINNGYLITLERNLKELDIPIPQEPVEESSTENDSKNNSYSALLSKGVKVELVGLCQEPNEEAKWWNLNGTEISEPSFEASTRISIMKDVPIKYTFLVKAQGGEDISMKANIYEGYGYLTPVAQDGTALCFIKNPGESKPYHEDAFEKGPIEIGIAQGRWIKGQNAGGTLHIPRSYLIGGHDQIVIQPPRADNAEPDMVTSIWANVTSHDYEFKLVCKLKDGSTRESEQSYFTNADTIETGGLHNSSIKTFQFTFDRLTFDQIVDYELYYRKFEYVRFDNVEFKPASNNVTKNEVTSPFCVYGKVTNENGNPVSGVSINANCGIASLFPTGETVSDVNGNYRLYFKPGYILRDTIGFQAAIISVRKDGYNEASFNLAMSGDPEYELTVEQAKNFKGVILPNKPYKQDFVIVTIDNKFMTQDTNEIEWGQEIENIQIRVRMDQQFYEGQIPKFLMDVRNNGMEDLQLVLAPEWWELELDGKWYETGAWYSGVVPTMSLNSGEQKNGIEFVPTERWEWHNNHNPLKFLEGTHEVRLLHTVFRKNSNDRQSARVLSNSIAFEILPTEEQSGANVSQSVKDGVNIYFLADETIDFDTANAMPLSELELRDKPWISSQDIEMYDASSHCIYLKKERPEFPFKITSVRGSPFVVTANGQKCYMGVIIPAGSSYLPEDTIPIIHMTDFILLPSDIIRIMHSPFISPLDEQINKELNNSNIVQAFKDKSQYHAGLEIVLDKVDVAKTETGSSLSYTYTLINKDADDLYVFDPDKMGVGLFHYFNNCPGLLLEGGEKSIKADHDKVVKAPDSFDTIDKSWFSLIKSGQKMTRTVTLDAYPEIPQGKYECSFMFQSPGPRFTKEKRAQFEQRVWIGQIFATININVTVPFREEIENITEILSQVEDANDIKVRLGSVKPLGLELSNNSFWFEVENNSTKTIKFNRQPYVLKGMGNTNQGYIEITDINGNEIELASGGGALQHIEELSSGRRYKNERFGNGWSFRKAGPGIYRARVTLVVNVPESGKTFEVKSNWHEIEVTLCGYPLDFEPETALEKIRFACAYQGLIEFGHATSEEVVRMYEDIIEQYPDSKYELRAHYGIAMTVTEDRDPNLVTESDYALARKHYQEIIKKWPDVVTTDTMNARLQAYLNTPEFEKSRVDLYKWLTTLTSEQIMDSARNFHVEMVDPKEENEFSAQIIGSIIDTTNMWIYEHIKVLEETANCLGGEMPWGKPVDGLRCRWISEDGPYKVGDEIDLIVEVENCSSNVIFWECKSQMTLMVSELKARIRRAYGFKVEHDENVRLCTANEVSSHFGIGRPGVEGDSPFEGYYRIEPGGRLKMVVDDKRILEKPGINKLECFVSRYPFAPSMGKTYDDYLHCLPLAYIANEVEVSENVDWGWEEDGLQCRLVADKIEWKQGEVPSFKVSVRNNGNREFTIAQAQQVCEVLFDGGWYTWTGDISVKSSYFELGRQYNDIPVSLSDNWVHKEGFGPLKLDSRWHQVSVFFYANPIGDSNQPPVRFMSKNVDIHILPDEDSAITQDTNETPWGEELNGLRMRVTTPKGNVYKRVESLPLAIEVKNVSDKPIQYTDLIGTLEFKVIDENYQRIGVQGYLQNHITSWEGKEGLIEPGHIITDTCYFERISWRMPSVKDSLILQFQLPTVKDNPGHYPIRPYSNPVKIELDDTPFEHLLTSKDLPEKWTDDLNINYSEGGSIFAGTLKMRIRSNGKVTLISHQIGKKQKFEIPEGRHEYILERTELDNLIKSLQEFKIERLNEFNGKMYATDLMQIEFSLSNAGNTFHGSYEVFGSKTQPVMDLQNLMRQFITKIVTQNKSISQTETNINIKEIEPLASSRISEMFERIMNDEEIDLKLIYQSLIGPQTALKANAA